MYYEQLKSTLFGYKEIALREYFDHLDNHWCKMDIKTTKKMTKSFYQPWNQVEHVTKFAQRLDDEIIYLNTHNGIDITEANKLQFYTEQMLDSCYFDKAVIIKWESQSPRRKNGGKRRPTVRGEPRERRSTTSALAEQQKNAFRV